MMGSHLQEYVKWKGKVDWIATGESFVFQVRSLLTN